MTLCVCSTVAALAGSVPHAFAFGPTCTPTVGVSNWPTNTKPIRKTAIEQTDSVIQGVIDRQNTTFRPLNGKTVNFIKVAK
jgi:hypothetical protein